MKQQIKYSAPADKLLSFQEQDSSMPESDSGSDEPLSSKRAKTVQQSDIFKLIKRSLSSFLSSHDSFISNNATAISFSTQFQPITNFENFGQV